MIAMIGVGAAVPSIDYGCLMNVESVTVDVKCCARCGQDHAQLRFQKLTRPGPRHNFWAPCPTNEEPIMMSASSDKKKKKRPVKRDRQTEGWMRTIRHLRQRYKPLAVEELPEM